MRNSPESVEEVAAGLEQVGYLPGESTALVGGGGGNSAVGSRRIEFQCRLAF